MPKAEAPIFIESIARGIAGLLDARARLPSLLARLSTLDKTTAASGLKSPGKSARQFEAAASDTATAKTHDTKRFTMVLP